MSKRTDKDVSTEELFAKLYISAAKHIQDSTLSFVEVYDRKYKMYNKLLANHLNSEPFKFFKNTHKQWEEKKEELEKQKKLAYDNFIEEFKNLDDIVNLMLT